ncbi:MAG: sugar phosphate isomerase/epimerase [Oscillospiraceae bacterium]|nr:sugar phosphate isomerase/epimerase [Oscillospiraceae bacterium]
MVKLGYMTNAFGPLVGTGGGVTCMKEVGYVTMCDDDVQLQKVAEKGYKYFEMFEGNICSYEGNPEAFEALMAKHGIALLGVYVGCHFIYPDALPDELAKVARVAKLAKRFGAKHIVLGGGSIRAAGIQEGDYKLLADGIDQAAAVIKSHGLTPTYHPHLGSLAETPEQIHKLFALTDIGFCPDVAHLIAGGSDALELLKQYYDRIPYIHLKDFDGTNFVPLGKGTAPIAEMVQFLLDKGYKGDWLVEIDGYPGDPSEACETSYNFLKGKLI